MTGYVSVKNNACIYLSMRTLRNFRKDPQDEIDGDRKHSSAKFVVDIK